MRNYLYSFLFIVAIASGLYYFSTKIEKKDFGWKKAYQVPESVLRMKEDFAFSEVADEYGEGLNGCAAFDPAPGSPAYTGYGADLRGGLLCTVEIDSKGSVYFFYLHTDPVTGSPLGIEYALKGKEEASQYISLAEGENAEEREIEVPYDQDFIIFEDVNFDGVKDVLVTAFTGATGNRSYMVFTYRKDEHAFLEDADYSAIMNLETDPRTKVIKSVVGMGMAGLSYFSRVYRVDDGKPVLIEEIVQEPKPGSDFSIMQKVTRRLIKGQLVEVAREEFAI